MGFLSSLVGIIGFGIGIPIGLILGFFLFIYFEPRDVKDPLIRPLHEFDSSSLLDILPDIPLWVKNPDYERVDWMNDYIHDIWPYLDKAICGIIRSTAGTIFAEYIGKFQIKTVDFESLSLGTLPPSIHVVGFTNICSTTDNFETSCANLSMFCESSSVFDGEATHRLWTEITGSGYHGNPWFVSICSGNYKKSSS